MDRKILYLQLLTFFMLIVLSGCDESIPPTPDFVQTEIVPFETPSRTTDSASPTSTDISPSMTPTEPTVTTQEESTLPAEPTVTTQEESTLPATTIPIDETPYATARVNANVRVGASTDHATVGILQKGDSAVIIARNNEGTWWNIRLNSGAEGWIGNSVVSILGNVLQLPVKDSPSLPVTPPPTLSESITYSQTAHDVWDCKLVVDDKFEWYKAITYSENGVVVRVEIIDGPFQGYWQPGCPAQPPTPTPTPCGMYGCGSDTNVRPTRTGLLLTFAIFFSTLITIHIRIRQN